MNQNKKSKRAERLGARRKNNQGLIMEVIEYYNTDDIVVRFVETGDVKRTRWREFSKGQVAISNVSLQNFIRKSSRRFKRDMRFGCVAVSLAAITGVSLIVFGIIKIISLL